MNTLADNLRWLKANPDFDEKPASLEEFLGPEYLNLENTTRERIKQELVAIVGDSVNAERPTKYQLAMITGAIGIGKTTVASIVLPYLVHWCLCLKDPQAFFGLMPGSRIAFMQMSTSEKQALDVVFGDIAARIQHAPWFKKYAYDPKYTKMFKFPKDIWIIPGDSAETTFEGYNILGGILDEADSHKVTQNKDYAEQGYRTIFNRMSSRFGDRGFLLVIGQMKKQVGFAANKFKEFEHDDDAYAVSLTIWEARGDDYYRCAAVGKHEHNESNPAGVVCGQVHKFAYDKQRKQLIPDAIARAPGFSNDHVMWIPELYRKQFENKPEEALKDLAGIPPLVGSAFISLVHKVHACRDRWVARYVDELFHGDPRLAEPPVDPDGRIAPWFMAPNTLRRTAHVDIGYAEHGDALGIAMGHCAEMVVDDEGERKPHIVIDFLMRMTAPPGGEIFLGDMRRVLYALRKEFRYKLERCTLDGFQSQDTIQQLNKKKIQAEYLSMDRLILPYHDLREAIYEDRIDFPPYMVHLRHGDIEVVEIAVKELMELVDNGNKIDHPEGGSKDVADAIAGVTTTLMGDTRFHRRRSALSTIRDKKSDSSYPTAGGMSHPAYTGDTGLSAPLAPVIGQTSR